MSEEASAMQVEPDDFILSFEGDSDGHTEIATTEEVSDLPADLVNTDVSDLANNPSLWLGLEGAMESHVNSEANVSAMVEEHIQMNESLIQMSAPNSLMVETLSHSEEVETMNMEVDVQTSEVSQVEELSSMPSMDSFMDHKDLGLDIMTKDAAPPPSSHPMIPVTLSLPMVPKTVLPSTQMKKIVTTVPTTSQVTKVVLAPAGHQNSSGQPFLFTVPSSGSGNSGLASILAPNASIRFVNAGSKVVTSNHTSVTQSVRLMSPTKTITLQQAQQLGLISPKKGQSLIVSKVAVTSSASAANSSQSGGSILAGKTGAKFAGGNVTLVRSASLSAKTPTKIAPAPSVSTASTAQQQPTSLLIKNAAGQVTMATLVQARPNITGNTGSNLSQQKFVLRPAAPGSVNSTQIRQGSSTQPAQYIRLTTAQALAAGILPTSHSAHTDSGGQQQLQIGGNKIQLVRVVNPGAVGGNLVTTSASPKVVISSSSTGTVRISSPLIQQQSGKSGSVTKAGLQVKTTNVGATSSSITTPTGAQRILLPAGSSLSTNIMMMPAQYVTLSSTPTLNSSSTTLPNNSGAGATIMSVIDTTPTPVSTPVAPSRSSGQHPKSASVPSPESTTPSTAAASAPATPGSQSKASINVLESNGLKQRKPCNCTKSQCLKLYCDCFANGEFCHGCNCVCCANNLEHEELRLRAIRSCLDRNPHAFKPKIGVGWGPEPRRHNKGCHCKRSGCLKNYCECYEAKIACSDMCKCVGCKNCVDPVASPPGVAEKKSSKIATLLSQQPNHSEGRSASNPAAYSGKHQEERSSLDPCKGFAATSSAPGVSRPPFSFITQEVVEATCQCLLAQAEEAERLCKTPVETEGLVLEEFGRCLLQIIEYASKAKVSASP